MSTTGWDGREIFAKKLTADGLFVTLKLNTPTHNLRTNRLEISVSSGATVRLIEKYLCSCVCEPSGVASTKNNFLEDGKGTLNDVWIDPSTRFVAIQSFLELKELIKSEDNESFCIKIERYGDHPGKKSIKFLTLVLEIFFQNQHYQVYVTIRIMSVNGNRGCTTKGSCFISDLIENEQDEFLQAIIDAKQSKKSVASKSSKRKKTPNKESKATVIMNNQFISFMDEARDILNILNSDMVDEDSGNNNPTLFHNVVCTKIHFENGPNYGGQANTLYLSLKDISNTNNPTSLVQEHAQYLNIRFVPKDYPGVEIAIPQLVHVGNLGNYAAVHFITPPLLTYFEGDLDTWVFITVNDELLKGDISYIFYDTKKTVQSDNIQAINFHLPYSDYHALRNGQYKTTEEIRANYTPVVSIFNIGQFARQQYHQSLESFEDLGHFTQNFQKHFGRIVDVFGYNFAGFLKHNNFEVSGITFEEVIQPVENTDETLITENTDKTLITVKPPEVRKEEKILSAEESTDIILKTIQHRIPLTDEKMIESSVKALTQKMNTDIDPKEAENYILNNIVVQKYLENYFGPGKRHARTDKVPYLNLKLVIFDSNALPTHDGQNKTPKLKAALFFAKFVILFDEKSHMIVIEDQEKKENFLYQSFYDCNIYTVRKSEDIDTFLTKLAEFNCAWNSSQFYDEKNNNTAHYVITALKYLGIWDSTTSTSLWAKFASNVCERKPLEKHVTIYPDFFHMDSKNSIPAMLSGAKAASCPRLKEKLLEYTQELSDAPFKYSFSGYSDNPEIEEKSARTELEFICELLRECGESYLRNMEDGVRVQRLLKKIMQTNYGQSLTPETWQHLRQLSDKHNQTFHKQMYNFPGFFNLIKPTQKSEFVEKTAKLYLENRAQIMITNV